MNDHSKVIDALGGKRGIIDSGLPSLAFVIVFTITKKLDLSLVIAVSIAVVAAIARLVKRDTIQHALSGLIGVLVCAWFSRSTGKAENFFLPGMIKSGIYGVVYLVANLIRWPILGLVLGPILGENLGWRKNPVRLRAYLLAGWVWVALFVVRLALQVPLYLANQTTALGVVTLIVGWPLFLVTVYLTWAILKRTSPVVESEVKED
ncbi:unannotated protein [freshwater metagenome]|uniref:Unannotated protein n=1 Tax=freshwater metagenome TaxID=449393 RepID=A0A6J6MEN6_9ZZZZ|nr:DUF3159 domain-containing protein [Actinomycetota bacterium]MSY52348.1 DUF3159 domain-containing protein [Actinomycetota bacterium]MSY87247.1 DUF3159 domain-containing protein [Actinomycetota bacterium]MTA50357.1 DUF3159 domain-containing protein [Actinomycetota bacterium]